MTLDCGRKRQTDPNTHTQRFNGIQLCIHESVYRFNAMFTLNIVCCFSIAHPHAWRARTRSRLLVGSVFPLDNMCFCLFFFHIFSLLLAFCSAIICSIAISISISFLVDISILGKVRDRGAMYRNLIAFPMIQHRHLRHIKWNSLSTHNTKENGWKSTQQFTFCDWKTSFWNFPFALSFSHSVPLFVCS